MTIATINRFIRLFDQAFQGLAVKVAMPEVERLAMLIHSSMDQPRRAYHTSEHVFGMCEGLNARQVLATLFHDLVYVQLDNGVPARAESLLRDVVHTVDEQMVLLPYKRDDLSMKVCCGVFGFEPGQTLALFGGLNEFLSAVVALRLLVPYLPKHELLAIAACIEATVAFRGPDDDGCGAPQRLARRVQAVSNEIGVKLGNAEVDAIVVDAVVMANRDVGSFADRDPGHFLSNTWLLIEESNAPLAAVGVYSIQQYRGALSRMEKFLSTLNPEYVFHSHANVPTDRQLKSMGVAAGRNLDFTARYLGAKLVAVAVVEALALATGGDCPVSMFLGDIKAKGVKPDRAEDFLPATSPDDHPPIEPKLMRVLRGGRSRASSNDLTDSPLTAYVYQVLGDSGTQSAREEAERLFSGQVLPREFLKHLPKPLVRSVALACAQIASSRRGALERLAAA